MLAVLLFMCASTITPYESALMQARDRDMVLIVWVNTSCPPCREMLTDCLHVNMPSFEGDSSPRVVVGIKGATGTMLYFGDLRGTMSAERIRKHIQHSVERKNERPAPPPPPVQYQYNFVPRAYATQSC